MCSSDLIHGKESVQSLISMCGTLIVGQMGPGQSAETLARALGSREVERRNVSVSAPGPGSTVSYAREDLALYKPSELGTRLGKNREGTGVVMALATGGDVYELTWPIVMRKPLRRPFVAAAWTTASVAPVATLPPAFGAQGGAGRGADDGGTGGAPGGRTVGGAAASRDRLDPVRFGERDDAPPEPGPGDAGPERALGAQRVDEAVDLGE